MTNENNAKVSYYESLVYEIARILKSKGYEIANFSGVKVSNPEDHDGVGILKPSCKKGFLGWKKRGKHLGNLLLKNSAKGTSEKSKWILRVNGRENIQELTDLVNNELSDIADANIEIRLESEGSKEEAYLRDNCP